MDDELTRVLAGLRSAIDAKEEMEARHKLELAPLKEWIEKAQAYVFNRMNSANANTISAGGMQAARTVKTLAIASDWNAIYDHVRTTGDFHLLTRKLVRTGCVNYLEENGTPPPGVSLNQSYDLSLKRIRA